MHDTKAEENSTLSSSTDGLGDEAHIWRVAPAAALAAIVESSDDAIVSKTLDGTIRTWNAGAQRIFGYTPEEAIGKPITMLLPVDRLDEEVEIIRRLRAGERVDHFETVRVAKDGHLLDVSVTISPVRDPQGRIVGASKIARDITAQKLAERELRAAKEQAESASRAKDLFLSILSHELRTPLTPVLASLSFLEARPDLPVALRQEMGMLRLNVETEARLVDDLLDLTRITRGTLRLKPEVMDAHCSVRNALTMVGDAIDARQLHVTLALDAPEHHVSADPGRLQQVFLNLLSNAVKFTPPGGTITVRSESDCGRLAVDVNDTGMGIAPEIMPRLFKPFEQGDQQPGSGLSGLGLGLSISQSLMQMQGGTVSAASPGRGQGATFTVELKTVPARERRSAMPPGEQSSFGIRVLLVEDHADTRRVMDRLLSSFGCRVVAVGTVAQALAMADGNSFDLLISDIGLPDGTGNDIMRHLRERMDVKGIALSGFGQPDDLRRSQEAGFDAHLVKPINFQTLRQTLEKLVGAQRDS